MWKRFKFPFVGPKFSPKRQRLKGVITYKYVHLSDFTFFLIKARLWIQKPRVIRKEFFEDTRNIFKSKLKHTGPIVNTTLRRKDKDIDSSAAQTIGFVGGSQGSEEINNYVEQFLNSEVQTNFNVLHITGKTKYISELEFQNYISYDFLNDMDDFYKNIDILVGRAGGGSLEAAYLGIPQIVIPYKHGTTSSHQELNARYLEKKKFGYKVNSFDELLIKISEISLKIKSNDLDIPNIAIGNQTIAEEIYEHIN